MALSEEVLDSFQISLSTFVNDTQKLSNHRGREVVIYPDEFQQHRSNLHERMNMYKVNTTHITHEKTVQNCKDIINCNSSRLCTRV